MRPPGARPRLSPKARVRFDRFSGRTLLVYPERALALNESARRVVALCTGTLDVPAIAARLAEEAGADTARVERDVRALIDALDRRALLSWEGT